MKNQKFVSIGLSVVVSFLGVAALAYGVTTISTGITTAGLSALNGGASTTIADVSNYLAVGGHATTTSAGALTLDSTLNVTGVTTLINASTTGMVTIKGGFISSASSSVAILNVAGLTSLNGNASTTVLSTTGNLIVNGYSTTTSKGIVVLATAISTTVPVACTAAINGGLVYNNNGLLCVCMGTTWTLATSTIGGACSY